MPIGAFIKSGLKEGIESLPDQAIKAESVPNVLAKKGIKEEEITFSGIQLPTEGKVTKAELQEEVTKRKDFFDVVETDAGYQRHSLAAGQNNPTYKERVYTFSQGEPGSRYTSEHFPEVQNYLFHTRSYDDTWGDQPVRILQELQSDLHQQKRVFTTTDVSAEQAKSIVQELDDLEQAYSFGSEEFVRSAKELYEGYANRAPTQVEFDMLINATNVEDVHGAFAGPGIPKSPLEKSWTRKAIEREVALAVEEGRSAIAIPIKGEGLENLVRGEGVQKFYESTVVNTAKKVAKSNGLDFSIVERDSVEYVVIKFKTAPVESKNFQDMYKLIDDAVANKDISALQPLGIDSNVFSQLAIAAKDESGARLGSPELREAIADRLKSFVSRPKAVVTSAPQFTLYSAPAAGIMALGLAIREGYTEEELKQSMLDKGYSDEDFTEAYQEATRVATALEQGFTETEIRETLKATHEPTVESIATEEPPVSESSYWKDSKILALQPVYKSGREMQAVQQRQKSFAALTSEDGLTMQETIKHLEVIYPSLTSMSTRISGFFGNKENKQISDEAAAASVQKIIDGAQKRFGIAFEFDPNTSTYYAITEEGEVDVTPSFFDRLKATAGEASFSLAGAIAGGAIASEAPIPHFPAKLATIIGATTLGAFGASVGADVDALQSSIALSENINAQALAMKEYTAAEIGVIADMGLATTTVAAKAFWNTMVNVKRFIANGNPQGAAKAMRESLFVSDEVAQETVDRLTRVAEVPTSVPDEQRILATMLSTPGFEGAVKSAVDLDVKTSMAVAKGVDTRAKDLLSMTAGPETERTARVLIEDLVNYERDVKQYFFDVRARAAASPQSRRFSFDYDRLVLDPVLTKMEKDLLPGPVLEKFAAQAAKIRRMSDSRTFSDLLDMRQLVNEFLYSKKLKNAKGFSELKAVKGRIDKAITEGAQVAVENPKQWLKDYSTANAKYSEMTKLRKNTLAKMLMKYDGKRPDRIAKQLAKYSGAVDGTFDEVLQVLPKRSKANVEKAVFNVLSDTFTAGKEGETRATHFPMLAEELRKITFTTPEMRKLKLAVNEMAKVFKNDIALSQASGQVHVQKFQSFLTADPVVRAQFAVASQAFNQVRKFAPTRKGHETALILKTAELLENPLNVKTMQQLIDEAGDVVDLAPFVRDLANEAARRQATNYDPNLGRIALFGDGKILSLKGTGKRTSIPTQQIASHEVQETIAEAEGINISNKVALDHALRERGYSAVQLGTNKVRRID